MYDDERESDSGRVVTISGAILGFALATFGGWRLYNSTLAMSAADDMRAMYEGIFSILLAVVVWGIAGRKALARTAEAQPTPDAEGRVPCPMCRERVLLGASVCPYCRGQIYAATPMKNIERRNLAVIVSFVAIYFLLRAVWS